MELQIKGAKKIELKGLVTAEGILMNFSTKTNTMSR